MNDQAVQLCTQVINSFDGTVKVAIGAVLTILLNLIIVVKIWLSQREVEKAVTGK